MVTFDNPRDESEATRCGHWMGAPKPGREEVVREHIDHEDWRPCEEERRAGQRFCARHQAFVDNVAQWVAELPEELRARLSEEPPC
jgi:hypothetical protein